MAIIAVAGGTGNVGRAIVDAIVAGGKHQVKILSRKVSYAKVNGNNEMYSAHMAALVQS